MISNAPTTDIHRLKEIIMAEYPPVNKQLLSIWRAESTTPLLNEVIDEWFEVIDHKKTMIDIHVAEHAMKLLEEDEAEEAHFAAGGTVGSVKHYFENADTSALPPSMAVYIREQLLTDPEIEGFDESNETFAMLKTAMDSIHEHATATQHQEEEKHEPVIEVMPPAPQPVNLDGEEEHAETPETTEPAGPTEREIIEEQIAAYEAGLKYAKGADKKELKDGIAELKAALKYLPETKAKGGHVATSKQITIGQEVTIEMRVPFEIKQHPNGDKYVSIEGKTYNTGIGLYEEEEDSLEDVSLRKFIQAYDYSSPIISREGQTLTIFQEIAGETTTDIKVQGESLVVNGKKYSSTIVFYSVDKSDTDVPVSKFGDVIDYGTAKIEMFEKGGPTSNASAWDFVTKYYPNYYSSDDIARNDDLHKIVDEEEQEGDDASELLASEFEGDRKKAEEAMRESDAAIYEEAIAGFIAQTGKVRSVGKFVSEYNNGHPYIQEKHTRYDNAIANYIYRHPEEEFKKGGRIKSAINRDRKYTSAQEWEKNYHRKGRRHFYHEHGGGFDDNLLAAGGSMADLKRKLQKGVAVKLVSWNGSTDPTKNSHIGKTRYVVSVQTNQVSFSTDKDAKSGSYWAFPPASLVELTDKGFKVYEPGTRPLNADEQRVWDAQPYDKEQYELDALTDGSTMYYRRKNYFENCEFPYLWGEWKNGKYYDSNHNVIIDRAVKGNLALEYEFVDAKGDGGGLDDDEPIEPGFIVMNETDGVPASPEIFKTVEEAQAFINEFPKRFAFQGYYTNSRMQRMNPKDVILEILPVGGEPLPFAKGGMLVYLDGQKADSFKTKKALYDFVRQQANTSVKKVEIDYGNRIIPTFDTYLIEDGKLIHKGELIQPNYDKEAAEKRRSDTEKSFNKLLGYEKGGSAGEDYFGFDNRYSTPRKLNDFQYKDVTNESYIVRLKDGKLMEESSSGAVKEITPSEFDAIKKTYGNDQGVFKAEKSHGGTAKMEVASHAKKPRKITPHIQSPTNFDIRISKKLAEALLNKNSGVLNDADIYCRELGTNGMWEQFRKSDMVSGKIPTKYKTFELWITGDASKEDLTKELNEFSNNLK